MRFTVHDQPQSQQWCYRTLQTTFEDVKMRTKTDEKEYNRKPRPKWHDTLLLKLLKLGMYIYTVCYTYRGPKGTWGKNNGAPYIIYIIIIYTIIMKSCYFIFSEQLSPKLPYINPKMRQKKSKIMLHFKDGLYFTPC